MSLGRGSARAGLICLSALYHTVTIAGSLSTVVYLLNVLERRFLGAIATATVRSIVYERGGRQNTIYGALAASSLLF